ncbi:insulinase family protein [Marinomonas colpomeniae]|nr:insulinase family protein [Marinomonas colpomeniae]
MINSFKKLTPYFVFLSSLSSFSAMADNDSFIQSNAKTKANMQTIIDSTKEEPITKIPHKSQTDTNEYYSTRLPNNLKVILVSDSKAERFSASISVNVGNAQDPKKQQGLAHFLEHMLFLGTEKYPESGDYQSFIHTNGGSHNAYTSTDTTNFYFDIKPSAYKDALDRFSQFFITPLFNESLTQREKNAVDSEYKAKFKDESRRNTQAFKTLINIEHPYNRFTVGNLDTLKDLPDNPLREQLLSLYQDNYFAENMALVMVANLPYEEMATLAHDYFSSINSKPKNAIEISPLEKKYYPTLIPVNQPHLQFVRPLIDNDSISFYYQIDAQTKNYKTQPARYLSYILGNENKNSLYASLKAEGLINNLSARTSEDYGDNAFFIVKINLTSKGMEKIDAIAQRFFATISLLRSTPIKPLYLQEGLQLSQMMFNHQNYVDPQNLARSLSARALKIPSKDLLSSFRIDEAANTKKISQLLQQLNTENLLIQIASNKETPNHWADQPPKWKTEPWYQSEYSNNNFSQSFLNLVNFAVTSTQVKLPEKNNFIPESLGLIDQQDDTPFIAFKKEGFTYWNKSDSSFNKPISMNFLAMRFDNAADTAEHTLLNRLWSRLFNESVSEHTYAPYIAGLGFSFYPHINGVTLRTNGYSDKQANYIVWLIDQIFLFRPSLEHFNLAKQQLKKDLSNQKSRQAYHNANTALNTLITKNSFTTKELESALEALTIQDLQDFTKKARDSFDVVGYSTGNLTKEQTTELAQTLYQRFERRLTPRKPIRIETKELIAQQKSHYQFTSTSNDNVVLYTLIDTSTQDLLADDAITEKGCFSILKKLVNIPFYQELRTDKQLGYIVGTQNLSTRNTPILGLLVQSPNKDTKTLIEAMEEFLEAQKIRLETLSEQEFQEAKTALVNELKEKAKNLSDNALNEWHQIAQKEPNFKSRDNWIKTVEKIQRKDFITLVGKKLQSIESTRIIIHNKPFPIELIEQDNWLETSPHNPLPTEEYTQEENQKTESRLGQLITSERDQA